MPEIEALGLLRRAGITLRVEGDSLVASPGSALTDEMKALITDHKAELVRALVEPTKLDMDESSTSMRQSHLGYTQADLEEMDKLMRELAECEDWPEDALRKALADRKRMAPVRVPGALQAIRKAHRAAVAVWPGSPATRTEIVLCI